MSKQYDQQGKKFENHFHLITMNKKDYVDLSQELKETSLPGADAVTAICKDTIYKSQLILAHSKGLCIDSIDFKKSQ